MQAVKVGLLFAVLLTGGCVQRLTDFTVISTKNVALEGVSRSPTRVTGKDCVVVFIIPLGMPNLKEAIDDAIEKAGPGYDALVDGVVYSKNKSFLIGQVCYEVTGTPINTRSKAASEVAPDRILRGSTDDTGHPCNAEWKEIAEARQAKLKSCLGGGGGCESESKAYAEARAKAGNCWPK